MKTKPLDRIELTRRKMAFREAMKHAHEVPSAPGVDEHPDPVQIDAYHCPLCGGELVRYEGCYMCRQCGWSKC